MNEHIYTHIQTYTYTYICACVEHSKARRRKQGRRRKKEGWAGGRRVCHIKSINGSQGKEEMGRDRGNINGTIIKTFTPPPPTSKLAIILFFNPSGNSSVIGIPEEGWIFIPESGRTASCSILPPILPLTPSIR